MTSPAAARPTNASAPVTTLRSWLDRLAAGDRLAVIRLGEESVDAAAVLDPRPGARWRDLIG